MPNVTQAPPYSALADIYGLAGFAHYSEALSDRLMELVFAQDWVGRTILDLGSGTGELATKMAASGYRVVAVDSSPAMMQIAQARAAPMGLSMDWLPADIRSFKLDTSADLAFCVGETLNLLPTLADLEGTFQQVSRALEPGKLFIFDLRTIRGLAAIGNSEQVVFDDGENALLIAQNQFNYENLMLTTTYQLVVRDGPDWKRSQEVHLRRGYPVQAFTQRLLPKTGFKLLKILNIQFEEIDPAHSDQLIFLVQKEG